jgi:hypothetical protein
MIIKSCYFCCCGDKKLCGYARAASVGFSF